MYVLFLAVDLYFIVENIDCFVTPYNVWPCDCDVTTRIYRTGKLNVRYWALPSISGASILVVQYNTLCFVESILAIQYSAQYQVPFDVREEIRTMILLWGDLRTVRFRCVISRWLATKPPGQSRARATSPTLGKSFLLSSVL